MGFCLWKLQVQLGLLSNFLVEISTVSSNESKGFVMNSDSSVGIATHYGMNCPGIESGWGREIPYPPRPFLEPTQPPI